MKFEDKKSGNFVQTGLDAPIGASILPKAKSNLSGVPYFESDNPSISQMFLNDFDDARRDRSPGDLPPSRPSLPYDAILPGHGERPDNCGSEQVFFCSSCGHVWVGESQCNSRECPECWRNWLSIEAEESATRMWVLSRKVYLGKSLGRYRAGRIVHCMVSFRVRGLSYSKARAKAEKIAMKHGVSGGIVIFHPFRVDHDSGQYKHDGTVHFHIVGIAKGDVLWPEKGQVMNDYIFKQIQDPSSRGGKPTYRGVRKFDELLRLIRYQLSHCGIIKGHHAVAWFGCLTYNLKVFGVSFNSKERFIQDYPEVVEYLSRYRGKACPTCGSLQVLHVFNPEFVHVLRQGLDPCEVCL